MTQNHYLTESKQKTESQNYEMVCVGKDLSGYPGSVQGQIGWGFEQSDLVICWSGWI